jgi:hypothetical protein
MKQFILISIGLLTGWSLLAQPLAGKFFIGGDVKFLISKSTTETRGTKQDNGTSYSLSVLPMAGFFFTDKIAVGTGLGVLESIDKNPNASLEKQVRTTYSLNPFGRYYVIKKTGGIFIELALSAGIGTYKAYYASITTTEHQMAFSAGLTPGVYYYITDKLALEAKFGWGGYRTSISNQGSDMKDVYSSFGLDISPDSFTFGMTIRL